MGDKNANEGQGGETKKPQWETKKPMRVKPGREKPMVGVWRQKGIMKEKSHN